MQLEQVAPVWGWNGEETAITITGRNLLPAVSLDGSGQVDAGFSAELLGSGGVELPLTGLSLQSYRSLDARLPAGGDPGRYDLRVTGPGGDTAELLDAFTVTESRADHIAFRLDQVAYGVGDTIELPLRLEDPDDQPVAEDLAIGVQVDPRDPDAVLGFEDGGLEDQVPVEGGVEGRLGADGQAWVLLSVDRPGDLLVTASPLDPESAVRGDEVQVAVQSGSPEEVRILLPTDGFTATAGEPFPVTLSLVDAMGNAVEDQPADILLYEECGNMTEQVTLLGTQTLELAVTGATGDACPLNRITAWGAASGQSNGFQVLPGPPAELEVLPTATSVRVGDPAGLLVWMTDAWENDAGPPSGELAVSDTAGSVESSSCLPSSGGVRYCEAVFGLAVASTQVVVSSAQDGIEGRSDPVEVLAGEPAELRIMEAPAGAVAGRSFELQVEVTDDRGNAADIDPGGSTPFVADDGHGTASCSWAGELEPGRHLLDCWATTAGLVDLAVSVPALGLDDVLEGFAVANGALASVALSVSSSTVTAGEPFTVYAAGADAWGNPYLVQSDPVLDLWEDSGTLSPSSLTLGSDGMASGTFMLTRAGAGTRISAGQAGVELGYTSLDVDPGAPDHLAVELPQGWAFLGEEQQATVSARDAWENPLPSYTSSATLGSAGGLFADVQVDLSGGQGSAGLTWEAAGLQDVVEAVDDAGLSGSSDPVDALDDSCADGPVAELLLDGGSEAVACLVSGSASVSASFSASTAGSHSIAAFHVDDGNGGSTRTTSTSATLTWEQEGAWLVRLVAADDAACGDLASAVAWVAGDDGQPAGPVTVVVADATMTAGSSVAGSTTVDLAATDCSGDLAAGGTLVVRTDLGELLGTTATGQGLAVTLDGSGAASVTWSVASETHAGTATIEAGTLDGASWGSGSAEVSGDSARPHVAWTDPSGRSSELLSQVQVGFTEPMLDVSFSPTTVKLLGAGGEVALDSLSLDSTGSVLSIVPADTVDASAATWTLSLAAGLRDRGGNFLDGAWTGAASAFSVTFGDVSDDGIEMSACPVSTARFVPDGDAGSGEEADQVDLSASATGVPAWWLMEVRDAGGGTARTEWTAASSSGATLSWDGRGDDGLVLAPGGFVVSVAAIDAQGNISTPCDQEVELVQRYSYPEAP